MGMFDQEEKTPRVVKPPSDAESGDLPKRRGRPPGSTNKASTAKIESGLNDFMSGIAVTFTVSGNDVCAVIFAERGPRVAAAWAELARQNPGVRKILTKMMEGSAWAGVVIASASVAIPVGQYYGVVPAIPSPFSLTLEEQTKVAEMQQARARIVDMANANGHDAT